MILEFLFPVYFLLLFVLGVFLCLTKKNYKKIRKRKGQNCFRGYGHCMSGWIRDSKRRRLVRVETEHEPEKKSEPE